MAYNNPVRQLRLCVWLYCRKKAASFFMVHYSILRYKKARESESNVSVSPALNSRFMCSNGPSSAYDHPCWTQSILSFKFRTMKRLAGYVSKQNANFMLVSLKSPMVPVSGGHTTLLYR